MLEARCVALAPGGPWGHSLAAVQAAKKCKIQGTFMAATATRIDCDIHPAVDGTRTTLQERLTKGRPGRHVRRCRTEWALQLMILSAGHMPRGVGAPRETTPKENLPPTGVRELVQRLETAIESLDATMDECRHRFGMERVGRHFLLGPLRIDQWRRYHVLHLRHHLTQVSELRETLSVEVLRKPEMARV